MLLTDPIIIIKIQRLSLQRKTSSCFIQRNSELITLFNIIFFVYLYVFTMFKDHRDFSKYQYDPILFIDPTDLLIYQYDLIS